MNSQDARGEIRFGKEQVQNVQNVIFCSSFLKSEYDRLSPVKLFSCNFSLHGVTFFKYGNESLYHINKIKMIVVINNNINK